MTALYSKYDCGAVLYLDGMPMTVVGVLHRPCWVEYEMQYVLNGEVKQAWVAEWRLKGVEG